MSDELTIQAVNQPQVQQKKKSTTPYVLGGVVGGGLVGAGVNSLVKKPTSWEDVVKEAKDTTDFSTKAEPASWEAVKKNAQEVADLEAKLKAVPEKTLTSGAEFDALEAAKKARQEEFDRLFKAEKESGKGIKTSIPAAENVDIPKKQRKEYNAIRDDYRKVIKDMWTNKSGEYQKLGEKMRNADAAYDAKVNQWATEYHNAVAASGSGKPKITLKSYFAVNDSTGKKSLIYQDMNKFYQDQLKATGKYNVANPKGQKAMRTKAHELTVQNLNNMKQYIENTDKLASIKVDPAQLAAAKATTYQDVIKKSSEKYARELEIINGSRKVSKKIKADLINDLTAEYGCTKDELEKVLSKRIKIAQKYEPTLEKIKKAKDNSYLSGIYAKQREAYRQQELKPVMQKFKKKFPELCKEKSSLSDSEITEKVNKALEKTDFEKNLKDAQIKFDKALEAKGTANTAAKETIEKELAAAKGKLQNAAEELGKKFKKGGTNKWVAAGIGAVIGAAALYGVAASKNKKAV